MKKTGFSLMTAAILALSMSACGTGRNDLTAEQVAGTWVHILSNGTDTITLNSDMTYHKVIRLTSYPLDEITTDDAYSLSGDTISIRDDDIVSAYKVIFEDGAMIWDNGHNEIRYEKQ